MKKNPGFTLLEVLVALTILAIGIIAIMRLFPSSLRQVQVARERTAVATLAKTELGKVRAGGVGNQLSTWAAQNALRQLDSTQQAYALYDSWRSSVQRIGGDVDLYRITFMVRMFDGREEKFVTYVTQQ
jgi:prepilin-type N-terminal cleavage/methylation domain-containing protein